MKYIVFNLETTTCYVFYGNPKKRGNLNACKNWEIVNLHTVREMKGKEKLTELKATENKNIYNIFVEYCEKLNKSGEL